MNLMSVYKKESECIVNKYHYHLQPFTQQVMKNKKLTLILQMWKCLNIKSWKHAVKSFTNANDQRLAYLKPLATIFKNMDTFSISDKTKISRLTTNTIYVLQINKDQVFLNSGIPD